jgi:hypothetical protein
MTVEQDQVEVRTKLEEARRLDTGVLIKYQSPTARTPTVFLVFPKHIVQHGGHWHVEGWAAPFLRGRRLGGSSRRAGERRRFRLDRMLAVEACTAESQGPSDKSILGKIVERIEYQFATRGLIGGLVGLFLDVLVVAFFVVLTVSLLKWLWRVVNA